MSMGYGAKAYLDKLTDTTAVYRYCSYDQNVPERRDPFPDGFLLIRRSCLESCAGASLYDLLTNGSVSVENCSSCWSTSSDFAGTDVMALRLLRKLFRLYLEEQHLPEQVLYDY